MDINVLKTFVAVCEYSGFSAAADKLGYSQSTISSQIKQLENELNAVLFDRIRHNTSMTSQGAIVLEYAQKMIELNQKMTDSLHNPGKISGEVRLAMSDSVCSCYFTDDYLEFHNLYPDITLKIIAAGTEQMFDMLRKNEVDIVFTLDNHIYDSEFVICSESKMLTHFVASKHHPMAFRNNIPLADICREPFCLTEKNMSYRDMLDERLASESLEIKPVLEIGSPEQICRILEASHLVSFLPDYVTRKYIDSGSLVDLSVENAPVSVWTQILIHRNKWRSPAMNALIEYYSQIING